jgi:hydroxypyruvate isomerase
MIVVEPRSRLADRSTRDEFLAGVRESAVAANRIGCRALVALSGEVVGGAAAQVQDEAIVASLRAAAPIAEKHGLLLLLEPLNDRVDHPGTYLTGTVHGLDLVERVGHRSVGLLYDVYHSATMGERPVEVIGDRGALVGHVHVADTGGRREPGTGSIDWAAVVDGLRSRGYDGYVGLEYVPTRPSTESLQFVRRVL